MTFAKYAAAGAALSLAVATISVPAMAQEANASQCLQTSKKVSSALSANQQSAQYQAATQEAHNGRDFCANGLYQIGLDHYNNALKILGAST